MVTTSPLTNLALALRNRPATGPKISRTIVLGGAWGLGTKNASTDWTTPRSSEASLIVPGAGAPIALIPRGATAPVFEVTALSGPVAEFAVKLLRSLRTTHQECCLFGTIDMPLNDPLALLVAANPAVSQTVPAHIDIELSGHLTYGQTVIDFDCKSGRPPNRDIVIEFDVDLTRQAFKRALDPVFETHSPSSQ